MRDDDDNVLKSYDLEAWEVPAVAEDLADGVIARLAGTEVGAAVPVEPTVPRRRALMIGGIAAAVIAGTVGVYALIHGAHRQGPTSGTVVADRAQPLSIEGVKADLDRGADVRWVRDGRKIRVEQHAGTASWRVDKDRTLVIDAGAMGASVEATGASLRVEVQMNAMDAKIIGASAVTAAAVAMVTVVVYEGHVKVSSPGQNTVIVEPGSTWQSAPPVPDPVVAGSVDEDAIEIHRERWNPFTGEYEETGSASDVTVDKSCDEVSCVLSNYDSACCAKFRKTNRSLDRVAITDTIATVKPKIHACGEKFPAKGIVKIAVKVRLNGTVSQASVKQTPDSRLGDCVAQVLRDARFPETDDGGSFTYPFVFDADGGRLGSPVQPPPGDCDADALKQKGMDQFNLGQHAAALVQFEAALRCKPSSELFRLAVMAACNSKNSAKAKYYFPKLSSIDQQRLQIICIRNAVEYQDDSAAKPACDADELKQKGMDSIQLGQHAAGLAQFEASLRCKPDDYVVQLAFMASCNARSSAKAKLYYKEMESTAQERLKIMCERNHVAYEDGPAGCDADALKDKGMALVNAGKHELALAKFEASLACKQDSYVMQLAFMAACNSQNSAKAKRYFPQLTPVQQQRTQIMCIRTNTEFE